MNVHENVSIHTKHIDVCCDIFLYTPPMAVIQPVNGITPRNEEKYFFGFTIPHHCRHVYYPVKKAVVDNLAIRKKVIF